MTLIVNLLVAFLLIVGAVFCDIGATAPPEYETALETPCTKHCHEEDGYIKNDLGEPQWISAPDDAHQNGKSKCHCRPSSKLPNFIKKVMNSGRLLSTWNKQTVSAVRDFLLQNNFKIEGSKAIKHDQNGKHTPKLNSGHKTPKLDLNTTPWVKKAVPLPRPRVTSEEHCNAECRQKDGSYILKKSQKDKGTISLKPTYEHVYIMVGHDEDGSGERWKCVCEFNEALLKELRRKSMNMAEDFKNAYAHGTLYGHLWLTNHGFKVQGLKGSTAEEQLITGENTLHFSPNESKEIPATATARRSLPQVQVKSPTSYF